MNYKQYLSKIGSKGGSKNTEAQNEARAKNGKLGGRPKKASLRTGLPHVAVQDFREVKETELIRRKPKKDDFRNALWQPRTKLEAHTDKEEKNPTPS